MKTGPKLFCTQNRPNCQFWHFLGKKICIRISVRKAGKENVTFFRGSRVPSDFFWIPSPVRGHLFWSQALCLTTTQRLLVVVLLFLLTKKLLILCFGTFCLSLCIDKEFLCIGLYQQKKFISVYQTHKCMSSRQLDSLLPTFVGHFRPLLAIFLASFFPSVLAHLSPFFFWPPLATIRCIFGPLFLDSRGVQAARCLFLPADFSPAPDRSFIDELLTS